MSATQKSQNSPTKLQIEGLPDARIVTLRILANNFRPPQRIEPSEWVEKNVIVPDGPFAGSAFDLSRTPYLREIVNCMSPHHPANVVTVRKSAQVGLTALAMSVIGYLACNHPVAMLVVFPTSVSVKQFNREKLQPTIDATPVLRRRIFEQKSRDEQGSSTLFKKFAGGFCVLTGANSSADLRSKTIPYVIADEIDEWPLDLDGQGHPMAMVDARQLSFKQSGKWKKLQTSTPTVEGISLVDAEFKKGDQRYYHVPCPDCGTRQKLIFENLKYSADYPHRAEYLCSACGVLIPHHKKSAMVSAGEWIAENAEPGVQPSFHIDALYSPFVTWDQIVEEFLKTDDDPIRLKSFYNMWLGRAVREQGEAPESEALFNRRADYQSGTVPFGAVILTAGVDVQADRIEYEVVAWGFCKTSWSVERGVIEGDTDNAATWTGLAAVLNKSWPDAHGTQMQIRVMAIDSGYRPQMIYQFVARHPRTIAVKGTGSHMALPIVRTTRQRLSLDGKKRFGVNLWTVGTWQIKAEVYGQLNLKGPNENGGYPPGWCFFPDDYTVDFFQQLTSERLVDVQKKGYITQEWHKLPGVANEALDCRVYALAALYQMQIAYWSPEQWRNALSRRGAPQMGVQQDLFSLIEVPDAPVQQRIQVSGPRQISGRGRGIVSSGRDHG